MSLRRAYAFSTVALVLTLACAASGCASIDMYYKKADREGPLANLNGVWASNDLSKVLVIDQTGQSARGAFSSFGSDRSTFVFPGTVQGRVLVGAADVSDQAKIDGFSYWALELAITAEPDGKAGSLAIVGMYGDPATALAPTVFQRLAGGVISETIPKDSLMKGALACRLPFDSSGRVITGSYPAPLRDAWIFLSYLHDTQGRVQPMRIVVPAESPRIAAHVPFSEDGLFGKAFDRPWLLSARSALPASARQTSTIEQKQYWWIVSPFWDAGSSDPTPSAMIAELYTQPPDSGASPVDAIEIARRVSSGNWNLSGGYIAGTSGLYRATARMENGAPAGVEVVDVAEPPLEDFLAAKETDVATARWRSGALLLVKSRTLPKMLRDGKTGDLSRLVERLEKLILDVNHEGELAKDQAQRAVETQSGDADRLREVSLVYKERIEVLKPILAALKEEIANRAK